MFKIKLNFGNIDYPPKLLTERPKYTKQGWINAVERQRIKALKQVIRWIKQGYLIEQLEDDTFIFKFD